MNVCVCVCVCVCKRERESLRSYRPSSLFANGFVVYDSLQCVHQPPFCLRTSQFSKLDVIFETGSNGIILFGRKMVVTQ